MRVAALYDVHGNMPALLAVLQEIAFERVDRIVFGGDLAAGPFPRDTVEHAGNLPNAVFVRGNTERYVIDTAEGRREPASITDEWMVGQLGPQHLDFLRTFEPSVSLDGVLYVHSTPGDDEVLYTRATPDERLRALLGGVDERVVVVGHTHMQFDRTVDGLRVVNAGSVGMPKDSVDASWALVVDGEPELRRTAYDRTPLEHVDWERIEVFLRPPDEDGTIALYESQAAAG
jgi:putative phosphoesterase